MNKYQLAIAADFVENDPKHTFHGWPLSMIVSYYQQYFHDKLTVEEIRVAIVDAFKVTK